MDQVRRVAQQQPALVKRLADQRDVSLRQVAEPAMELRLDVPCAKSRASSNSVR
jgi:hypothetical protein